MFRKINIKQDVVINVDLYRNRHEKLCEIPLSYIEKITYKFNDIDEISLSVPRYIYINGVKTTNHVFSKINTRQQLILTTISKDGTKKLQRFSLYNKKIVGKKDSGVKSFTAYSWEKTLEKQRITVEQLSRQLTNKDDNVNVGEGVLDLICNKTGWKVGYVDQDARYNMSSAVETFSKELCTKLSVNSITSNKVLFEKSVNIPASSKKPVYLTVEYTNLKTTDNSGNVLGNMNVYNNMTSEPITANITKIKAQQYSEAGNRYGVKYTFTLNDNGVTKSVTRICSFSNCLNKNISADKVVLGYDYAEVVTVRNIQYSTFEAFDDSAYKFLQDVQDVFNCMFVYDTMNNIINVYSKDNLNDNRGYILSFGSNVTDVSIEESEDIITCLKVESDNDVSIAEENPNGTNIIENYDYYIRNGIISDSLKEALEKYEILTTQSQDRWLKLKEERYVCVTNYTKAQSEATAYENRIKNLTYLLTSYITDKAADLQASTKAELDEVEALYGQVVKSMAAYQARLDQIDKDMAALGSDTNKLTATLDGKKIFSDEDISELNDMHEIETYTDSYYTTAYALYNYSKEYLEEKVKPKISFKLTADDLCSYINNINGWDYILELGTLFNLDKNELFDEIEDTEVRLIEMSIVPQKDEGKFIVNGFEFSNKETKEARLKVGSNIGKTTNKTSGVVSSFRTLWEESKTVNDFVGNMINSGLNIAASNIKGGVYRNILDFSEAGCFIINNTTSGNTDNQIYLGGGTIAITTDSWATSKVAIDANGVIAETLMGEILLGKQLAITSDDGLFYIGEGDTKKKEFGLKVFEKVGGTDRVFLGLCQDDSGTRRAMLRLKDKTGQEVVLSEEGIIQTSQFVCWDNVSPNYPMSIPYYSDAGVVSNKRVVLSLHFDKYRAFEKGAASGGSVKTSKSGGGGTSASGGGGTSAAGGGGTSAAGGGGTSADGGGGTSAVGGSATVETSSAWGGSIDTTITSVAQEYSTFPEKRQTSIPNTSTFAGHYHYIDPDFFLHRHKIDLSLPSHSHSISVSVPNHSHTIPKHKHDIPDHRHDIPNHKHDIPNHKHDIPDHSHDIDISHTHDLQYGIYEQNSKCSNVKVYVETDNKRVLVASKINSNVEVDLTNYITKGKKNLVIIESETNGRITCNFFTKAFVAF